MIPQLSLQEARQMVRQTSSAGDICWNTLIMGQQGEWTVIRNRTKERMGDIYTESHSCLGPQPGLQSSHFHFTLSIGTEVRTASMGTSQDVTCRVKEKGWCR